MSQFIDTGLRLRCTPRRAAEPFMISHDANKSSNDPMMEREEGMPDADRQRRGRLGFRPWRPTSVWAWLMWLLVALLFYLLISYVLLPWWYTPVPTDIPPPLPNSNTGRTG
jgi:polyferredoxin